MKLAIINGSPRGEKSNSAKLCSWILDGDNKEQIDATTYYLFKIGQHEKYIDSIKKADAILLVFPLYVDSMPSITKAFFEKMELEKEVFLGKPLYCIIHSGFPEIVQNLSLRKYLTYFATKIMGMDYKGTLIMAGSESMQMAPDQFFQKKIDLFKQLLTNVLENDSIDENWNNKLSGFYAMNKLQQGLFKLNPVTNMYWNSILKKNNALKDVKATPYA